jgi:hypothetical protein
MTMPEKRPPRPRDTNQLAKRVIDVATGTESDEPPEPKGKQISALARAASMTPERRQEIGRKAAAARWGRATP